jgi:hypothetical protein
MYKAYVVYGSRFTVHGKNVICFSLTNHKPYTVYLMPYTVHRIPYTLLLHTKIRLVK